MDLTEKILNFALLRRAGVMEYPNGEEAEISLPRYLRSKSVDLDRKVGRGAKGRSMCQTSEL